MALIETASTTLHHNVWRFKKCTAQIEVNNQYYDFSEEGDKVFGKSFLITTNETDKFDFVPVLKIFEAEILQRPEPDEQIFGEIPIDNQFHDIQPLTLHFKSPRYYLRTDKYLEIQVEGPIIPIKALRFFIEVNKQAIKGKVTKRYQYIDATNEEVLARLVLAEIEIDGRNYYLCLVRCR